MNSAVAKEQLNQCVSNMREELVDRQCALIRTLEETRVRKSEVLNTQLSEKQSLRDNTGLVMYTQELLKENDQPCFVQAARVTHNRCECVWVSGCLGVCMSGYKYACIFPIVCLMRMLVVQVLNTQQPIACCLIPCYLFTYISLSQYTIITVYCTPLCHSLLITTCHHMFIQLDRIMS